MLATAFGTGQVAYSILWFALFLIEIWLMFSVFIDIFRSHDLRGWAKALWILFVVLIPLAGILVYFIARGDKMRAHQLAARQGGWWDGPSAGPGAGPPGWGGAGAPPGWGGPPGRSAHDVIASLHRLTELRDRGEISADQFRRLRDELLQEDQP